jgi:hypothetical protein
MAQDNQDDTTQQSNFNDHNEQVDHIPLDENPMQESQYSTVNAIDNQYDKLDLEKGGEDQHALISNQQIDVSLLPKLEKIVFNPLQEDSLYVGFINIGITGLVFLVIAAIVAFFSSTIRPYVLLIYLIIILVFVVITYAEYRSFRNSGYALREEDLFFKTGWLWTSLLAIPYKRIQHLEVNQGPISRLFDLATLSVYTAGGTSSDMEIEGIKQEEAEAIKAFILQKNKNLKEQLTDDQTV